MIFRLYCPQTGQEFISQAMKVSSNSVPLPVSFFYLFHLEREPSGY